jgi:release factor glutamine methyltransferase
MSPAKRQDDARRMRPRQLTPTAGTSARSLVLSATERLRSAGSPSPRLDAELLVAHAFGRDRTWVHAHPDASLDQSEARGLDEWLARRTTGEPIAYIRGFKEWFSLRVATDSRALIPRPETELLAEAAIEEIAGRLVRDDAPISVWEVATGSGAVALAVALRFRAALVLGRIRLAASDVSAEALELAAENLAATGVAGLVTLGCGDLLEPAVLPAPLLPDVVIANLPYVPSAEVDAGAGSLRFEPRAATDGGEDGMDVIRRLLEQLPARLAPAGVALLEVGDGQAEIIRELLPSLPMAAEMATLADLSDVQRVVRIDRL